MNLIEQLKKLEKNYVTIGIHGLEGDQQKIIRLAPATRKVKKGFKEKVSENLTVSQVASWNEFGTKNIPARSFLRNTLKEKHREILVVAKRLLMSEPDKFYQLLGQYVLAEIKLKIARKIPPPNAPSTIQRKGSSTPLVDTGQLRNALTYRVWGET